LKEVKPRLRGKAKLCRHADDFVIGFERAADAARVYEVLPQRMANMDWSCTLKRRGSCRLRGRMGGNDRTGSSEFDFLGFTCTGNGAAKGYFRHGAWLLRDDVCRVEVFDPVRKHVTSRKGTSLTLAQAGSGFHHLGPPGFK
jgi:hypothetical protein